MREITRHKTGSWFTCDPPVTDTDEDWLILVEDVPTAMEEAEREGYDFCTHRDARDQYAMEEGHGDYWFACRKGKTNLVVISDEAYYLRSVGATLLCRQLNLKDKDDRIKLFRAIKFEEPYKGRYE